MAKFDYSYYEKNKLMRVELHPDFDMDEWNDLEGFFRKWLADGVLSWDLDMRLLAFMNSFMLGQLIGLNTILAAQGGTLRLVLARQSRVADLLTLSKVNRIISCHEV